MLNTCIYLFYLLYIHINSLYKMSGSPFKGKNWQHYDQSTAEVTGKLRNDYNLSKLQAAH